MPRLGWRLFAAGDFHDQMVAMLAAIFVNRPHRDTMRAGFEIARQPRRGIGLVGRLEAGRIARPVDRQNVKSVRTADGPYKNKMPPGCNTRPAPAIRPWQAAHGAMWIILQQTTALARLTGHTSAVASSRTGASRLGTAASVRNAAMLASALESMSLGSHDAPGSALAKNAACSPLPLAISKTSARGGKNLLSTANMGSRLRSTCG